eukprot:364914-Chlamydomonas_euryale.AAC.6
MQRLTLTSTRVGTGLHEHGPHTKSARVWVRGCMIRGSHRGCTHVRVGLHDPGLTSGMHACEGGAA